MTMFLLPDEDANAWIDALPIRDVALIKELLNEGLSEQQVAQFWLGRSGSDTTLGFSSGGTAKNYLESVQAEFRKLICGGPEYERIRGDFATIWGKGRGAVIAAVAVAVSSVTSIAVGVVMPVIALLFAALCKVGVTAWCAMDAS